MWSLMIPTWVDDGMAWHGIDGVGMAFCIAVFFPFLGVWF
jgi:hypothetical protein